MALAKKCDRCGKLYEHYPNGKKFQANAIRRCYMLDDGCLSSHDKIIDLCPECMEAFDESIVTGRFGDE